MDYCDTSAYDRPHEGELTITITLAEYRELVRTSTLYAMGRSGEPRPVVTDNLKEVE